MLAVHHHHGLVLRGGAVDDLGQAVLAVPLHRLPGVAGLVDGGESLEMVGAPARGDVREPHRLLGPAVLGRDLHPLHMHGVAGGLTSDLVGGEPGPLGQEIPKALPGGDPLQQCPDGPDVSPREVEAVGVGRLQDPLLEELHGERDHAPGRDGVHAEVVAPPVELDDRREIVVVAPGPEGGEGLVFEARAHGAGKGPVLHGVDLVAGDGAAIARQVLYDVRLQGVGVDPVGVVGVTRLVVLRGEAPHGVHQRYQTRRAVALLGWGELVFTDLSVGRQRKLLEPVRIVEAHAAEAPGRDRLEVLGAHHGPQPAAGRGPAVGGLNAGEAHAALPGRADAGDLEILVPFQAPQGPLGLGRPLSPELGGVADLGLSVAYGQVDRALGATGEDHHVEAAPFELGSEVPPRVGVAVDPGERGFGHHLEPARARPDRAGQRAGGKDEPRLRREGIHLGAHLVPEDLRPESVTPQIGLDEGVFQGACFHLGLGQVHPQGGPGVSFVASHDSPPFSCCPAGTDGPGPGNVKLVRLVARSRSMADRRLETARRSSATYSIAPDGQMRAHRGFPSHRSHLREIPAVKSNPIPP